MVLQPRKSHRPRRFECHVCKDMFRSPGGVTQHINAKHVTDSRPSQLNSAVYIEKHPILDGKFNVYSSINLADIYTYLATPCDLAGNFLPRNAPPPPAETKSPTDWTPFSSRVEYEVADLVFKQTQMSNPHVNRLLELWAADKLPSGGTSPFADYDDLHNVIDSIPEGDAPWHSFSVGYNGPLPEGIIPGWMTEEYQVWHRDPRQVVHQLLSNPEFNGHFDYTPYRQFQDNKRRWSDFMSGNWAWKQAVCGTLSNFHSYQTNSTRCFSRT